MAHHRDVHPDDVDGCFGCKVLGIGYDSHVTTRTTRDEAGNDTTEHRSGRVDIRINADPVKVQFGVTSSGE